MIKSGLFFVFAIMALFSPLGAYEEVKDLSELKWLNPSLSQRKTQKIKLKNGLEAYLISDPETQESSVALTVKAGSWDEPEEMPGLAHFLEHMLFMGTQKYPQEGSFEAFLAAYRGQTNAFTYNDITSYLFSVENRGFAEALDRFSSFFKEPLFNPSGVFREVKAIDQEWEMHKQSDSFLQLMVLKELAYKEHPFSRFNSGNEASLANVSQQALKAWYQTHYTADRMRLFILSALPLEEQIKLVEEDFNDIPVREVEFKKYEGPLLNPQFLGKLVAMEPIQDERSLSLIWELPYAWGAWRDEKPWSGVCSVLGDEGKGSALAVLKSEGLAEGLTCGDLRLSEDKVLFLIQVDLTEEGLKQKERVALRLFQALALLKEKGISKERFEENLVINKLKAEWAPRGEAYEEAQKNAFEQAYETLSTYPEQTRLTRRYSPEKTEEFLSWLTPERALYMLIAPSKVAGLKYGLKERWSRTAYDVFPFDSAQFASIKVPEEIKFPKTNPYLPTKLQVSEAAQTPYDKLPLPKKLVEKEKGELYFLKDTLYGLPRIYGSFEVMTPEIKGGAAQSWVMGEIYRQILKERLSQTVYEAETAGFSLDIDEADEGFVVTLSGYSEKASLLLNHLLAELSLPNLTQEKFESARKEVERQYKNKFFEPPLKRATQLLKEALWEPSLSQRQLLDAARNLSFEKFQPFLERLFKRNYLRALVIGDLEEEEAQRIWTYWQKALGGAAYPPSKHKEKIVAPWSDALGATTLTTRAKSQGSALILSVRDPDFSFKKRAAQQLVAKSLEKGYFNELRTKQQTSYLIGMSADEIKRDLFFNFLIQSSTHSPEELLWRTECFIECYLQELSHQISEEQFTLLKSTLRLRLKERPKSLDEMGKLLEKILFDLKDPEWIDKRIIALEELEYQEFIDLVKGMLGRGNPHRLALMVQGSVQGSGAPPFKYCPKSSVKLLKNSPAKNSAKPRK